MLTKAQEKLIRSLHRKKGRRESGQCLVEGEKVIATAGPAVQFTFSPEDSADYFSLVTTETPQPLAAVARIPDWTMDAVLSQRTIVVLDGVQDPGNVGTIFRLCLGFDASLILVESADPTSPKVVRSSVGALFQVPWINLTRDSASEALTNLHRSVFRLEAHENGIALQEIPQDDEILLIAGSEGQGIQLPTVGQAVYIQHNPALESLNVAQAVGLALYTRYQ